ncbi:TadE/TadG family type IV pilus assembly protein [Methylobacterium sp. 77]|uniref:TadE/TadG family type IV pilus assembly protein n=1 Tax=Methylobacterium sp. 77 TaxID=1101192 RepID=UPI00036C4635|nr:TadE/TadG family type IV pilus assembly protein [Methylobacterium sp. 77]
MKQLQGNTKRSFFDCTQGTSAVEFALVVPVLLGLFAGIVVFGIYLGASHNLRQLASDAARASIAGVNDQERADFARQRVSSALAGGAMFKPGTVDVQVGPDAADTSLYTVTLTFDSKALGFSGFSGLIPIPPDLIKSSVSVRRGGL